MSRYQFPSAGTTDASLLVSGTLSDARLSANVARLSAANVFEDKQSFSGVDHVGLCLNSLTTAEYTALTPANGDLYRDSTTDRIDARLSRGTVELIDTAGGQTIGGTVIVTGNVTTGSQCTFGNGAVSGRGYYNTSVGMCVGSGIPIGWSSNVDGGAAGYDVNISRSAAGVVRIGTTAANALGSLNLTNLTASGAIVASGYLTATGAAIDGGYGIRVNNFSFVQSYSSGKIRLGNSDTTAGFTLDVSTNNVANFRNFADNAPGNVTLGNLTASGTVVSSSAGPHVFGTGTTFQISGGHFLTLTSGGSYGWATGTNLHSTTNGGLNIRNGANTVLVSTDASGNLTASGTLRVGGGTVVQTILSATATLDFPSIGSNDTETLTITVTGAVAGDSVFLGCPATLEAGLIFCASVTAADTVTVRLHNSSGGSVNPASGTFRATVIRF